MKTSVLRQFLIGLGMISLVILPGCDRGGDDVAWWNGEQERIELSHRLELRRFQLQQIEPAMGFEEASRMIKSAAVSKFRVDELRRKKNELAGEFEGLESNLTNLRRSALLEKRRRATGMNLGEFKIPSGRVFTSASISGIDDAGVTLRHSDGSARLRFKDLSLEHRELFGLEQVSAATAEMKENADSIAYDRWIDGQIAESRIKDKQQAQESELARQREMKILAAAKSNVSDAARPLQDLATASRVRYRSERSRRSNGFTSYYYVNPSIRFNGYSSAGACGPSYGGRLDARPATPFTPWHRPDRVNFEP